MGTNYYAVIKAKNDLRDKLVELITNDDAADYDTIVNTACELYGDAVFDSGKKCLVGAKIHLGKKAHGWKFLWEHHLYTVNNGHVEETEIEPGHTIIKYVAEPKTLYSLYGDLTKDNIRLFLMRDDIDIYNEYRELQNKEEFIEWAFNTEGVDSLTCGRLREPKPVYDEWREPIIMGGYQIKLGATDFYSDGLRFAAFRDFS